MSKENVQNRGYAAMGAFGSSNKKIDAYIKSFYGYIAIQRLKNNMGEEAFFAQLETIKSQLKKISKENNIHVLDCIDTMLDKIEIRGVAVSDGIFNAVILASLQIIDEGMRNEKVKKKRKEKTRKLDII